MRISDHIPSGGAGLTAYQILKILPDREATIIDVVEALRWAEKDGKVIKQGIYYWRKK